MPRRRRIQRSLLTAADLAATFLFALEGAIAATYYDVNVLGVLVLGFSTALFGGVIRDVIIGYTPPASFRTPVYSIVALSAGFLILILDRATDIIPVLLLQVVDALGLGMFAVVGAVKALDHRITPLVAVLLGTVSAVGGGVVRDMLLNIVPVVLQGEIYAAAASAGAAVAVVGILLRVSRATATTAGFVVCVVIRLVSVNQGWALPTSADVKPAGVAPGSSGRRVELVMGWSWAGRGLVVGWPGQKQLAEVAGQVRGR